MTTIIAIVLITVFAFVGPQLFNSIKDNYESEPNTNGCEYIDYEIAEQVSAR